MPTCSYFLRFARLAGLMALVVAPATALAAPDLTCEVSTPVPNAIAGTATFTVTVTNNGDAAADNPFWTENPPIPIGAVVYSKGTKPTEAEGDEQFSFETVGVGETITIGEYTHAYPPGDYSTWCIVNPPGGGVITAEILYDDNIIGTDWTMPSPGELKADLVVTAVVPAGSCTSEACIPSVTIENIGTGEAIIGPLVDLWVGADQPDFANDPSDSVCIFNDAIPAGQSATVDCQELTFASVGQQAVWAYVDVFDDVDEINDGEAGVDNNGEEFALTVDGPPDAFVSEVNITQTVEQGPISFAVQISNSGGSDCLESKVDIYWQQTSEPDPAALAPSDSQTLASALKPTETLLANFSLAEPIDGDWQVWVFVECLDPAQDLDPANNVLTKDYISSGIPNEPPLLNAISGPSVCSEANRCQWTPDVTDETALPLVFRVIDGPLGMWANPDSGAIFYTAPLGSTAALVTATLEVSDQAGETASAGIEFTIVPPTEFAGKVGLENIGQMPATGANSRCQMVEVPGMGFAYVDQPKNQVRWFWDPKGADDFETATVVELSHNPAEGMELSCHVQAFEGGGYVVFDGKNNVILTYGSDHTLIRKIELNDLAAGLYSDFFTSAPNGTLIFLELTSSQTAKLVFVNPATGGLDTTWGGNHPTTPSAGIPGVMRLQYDGVSYQFYESYIWSNGQIVRLYNRHFTAEHLVDYTKAGDVNETLAVGDEICATLNCEQIVPPDDDKGEQPTWVLHARHDGGVLVTDYGTNTLRLFDGTFAPVAEFTLPATGALEANWPVGWVSLQEYGLSVSNVACEPTTAGGVACHDLVGQNGYVLDQFAELWENCPLLDVSPSVIHFGGVDTFGKKTIEVALSNKGGGVLQINGATLEAVGGSVLGLFTQTGLAAGADLLLFPGEVATLHLEYTPTTTGQHTATLAFDSNSCEPLDVAVIGFSGPAASVSPNPLVFTGVGPGVHSASVIIKSIGSDPLSVVGLSLDNPNGAAVFALNPANLSLTLEPGEQAEVEVLFDANTPGAYEGSIDVNFGGSVPDVEVPIDATTAAVITVDRPGFNFGTVSIGGTITRTVTIQNKGHAPLTFDKPKLSAPFGFVLSSANFQQTLALNEKTTLTLSYSPKVVGSALALVTVTHDDPNQPPFRLVGIGGTGTRLPEGFDGVLELSDPDDPLFAGPVGVAGAALELTTGGFAVYGVSTGSIHVIDGGGFPDPWFGVVGTLRITGPGGAFPTATGLGAGMVEMRTGGFALLSASEKKIYCVTADGQPNQHIGVGGVIDIGAQFGNSGALGPVMVQLGTSNHPFVVLDVDKDEFLALKLDGSFDSGVLGSGVIPLTGIEPVAGNGAALGITSAVSLSAAGGLAFADPDTDVFYALEEPDTNVMQLSAQSATGNAIAAGALTLYEDGYLYLDPAAATVRIIQTAEGDLAVGDPIDLAAAFPDSGALGSSLIGLSAGGIGVAYPDCDCIRFVGEDGAPLVLRPKFVAVLPNAIDFGVVGVGETSAPTTLTVTNGGSFPLNVDVSFSSGVFRLLDNAKSVTLEKGETAELQVVFQPGTVGSFAGELKLTTNDPDALSPAAIPLTGSTGSRLSIEPADPLIDFGNVEPGLDAFDAPVRFVNVCNTGADDLTLLSMTVDTSGVFQTGNAPPPIPNTVLEPGACHSTSVVCVPTDAGIFYGNVSIDHSDSNQPSPVTMSMVCRSGPQLEVTPTEIECSNVFLGSKDICGTVSVRNIGHEPLQLFDAIATGSGFDVIAAPILLQPGGAPYDMTVTFLALQPGTSQGTLTLLHDDPFAGGQTQVPLTAHVASAVSLTPAELDFGALQVDGQVTLPVQLLSGGGGTTVHFIAANAGGSSAFEVVGSPAAGTPLDAGAPLQINVRCAPTTSGLHDGTLNVATDAPGFGALTIPLTCIAGAHLLADPVAVDFGAVSANASVAIPVRITNVGLAAVNLGEATINQNEAEAAFSTPGPLHTLLQPGQQTAVTVFFAPGADGEYAGTLEFTPDVTPPLSVPLTGISGSKLGFVAASDPLDFGVVGIGTTNTRTALVVNLGSADLQLTPPIEFVGADPATTDAFGPFTLTGPAEVLVLAPGQSHPVPVTFSPVSIGDYSASITATSNKGSATLAIVGKAGGLLSVAPSVLDFGNTAQGQTVTLPVIIANQSPTAALDLTVFQGGNTAEFALDGVPGAGLTLAPNEVQEVQISFTPDAAGDFETTFTFISAQGVEGGAITVTATGRSGASAKLIWPISGFHGISGVSAGNTETRPIRVAAVGAAAVSLLGFTVDGPPGVFDLFGLGESGQLTVGSTEVAELVLTCQPSARGSFSGTIHIATDDDANPDIQVDVTCVTTGIATVAPASIDFGALPPLTESVQTVTVTNSGADVVLVEDAWLEGSPAFSLPDGAPQGVGLPLNESVGMDVRFSPTGNAGYTAVLHVQTNDPVHPIIEVPLTGFAGPHLALSRPVVNFCRDSATDQLLSVSNIGSTTLNVEDVAFIGVPDPDVSFYWADQEPGDVPLNQFALQPNASRNVWIQWGGNLPAGDVASSALLQVTSDDPVGAASTVRLVVGRGVAFDNGFTGVADVGAPGGAPVFPDAGVGAGVGELCTGGFALADPVGRKLWFATPEKDGEASGLSAWGADDGFTDLDGVIKAAGLDPTIAHDLGSFMAVQGPFVILGSPSAAAYVWLNADGSLATEVMDGGVVRLGDLLTGPVVGGAIMPFGATYVAVDSAGARVISITQAGLLNTSFGNGGIIELGAFFPEPTKTVGHAIVTLGSAPNGSIAVADSAASRILVTTPAGGADGSYGEAGVLDLAASGFGFAPAGIAGLVDDLPDLIGLDRVTGSLVFVTSDGSANLAKGDGGVLQVTGDGGAFGTGGLLGATIVPLTQTTDAATVQGQLIVLDDQNNDLLFVDADGSPFSFGTPELAVAGCPIELTADNNSQLLTFTNTGDASTFLDVQGPITAIEISSPDVTCLATDDAQPPEVCDVGMKLAGGTSESVNIQWNAPDSGCFEETLLIHHDGVNGPVLVCPMVLKTNAKAELTPSEAYTFPPQTVGTAFKKQFVLRNTGCAPLTVSNAVVNGIANDHYELDPHLEGGVVMLGPGEVHTMDLRCKPLDDGFHTVQLQLITTPPVDPILVNCQTGPVLEASAETLHFTQALPVGASDLAEIVLTSAGGSPAFVGTIEIDPPNPNFELVTIPAGELAVGASASVRVRFEPQTSEVNTCPQGNIAGAPVLRIPWNSGNVHEIAICASSTPELMFSPELVDFGWSPIGEPVLSTLTVTNIGATGIEVSPLAGPLAGTIFSLVDSSSFFLQPGESAEVDVQAIAEEIGEIGHGLQVEALGDPLADDDGIRIVPIRARVGACPALDETVLDFGEVTVESAQKSLSFELSNIGSVAVSTTVSDIEGAADTAIYRFADGTEKALDLEAGAAIPFTIEMTPTTTGLHVRTIRVEYDQAVIVGDCPLQHLIQLRVGVKNGDSGIAQPDAGPTPDEPDGAEIPGNEGEVVDSETGGTGGSADTVNAVEFEGITSGSGCGCDTAPSRGAPLQSGPAALLLAMLALAYWGRRKTIK